MTLLHMDGFDLADVEIRYQTRSGNGVSTATTRFNYGRAITLTDDFYGMNCGAVATIVIGAAVNVSAGTAYFTTYGDSGSNQHITIAMVAAGLITVRRGTTTGTQLGGSYSTPTGWFYIEAKITIGDGTAGSVIVKVNEAEVINTGGTDTKNGGTNTSVDNFRYGQTGGGSGASFDDVYALNTSGATNNDFLGDVRVLTLTPSGNGNSSQLTGSDGNSTDNYLLVDEKPYSTADYVQSSTATQKDTYTLEDMPAGAVTVFAVQDVAIANKNDAGYRGIKHVVRRGGTDYATTAKAIGVSAATYTNIRETDPSTSTAWVPANIDGMEAGVEIA